MDYFKTWRISRDRFYHLHKNLSQKKLKCCSLRIASAGFKTRCKYAVRFNIPKKGGLGL
ncbi:hypothetical protein LEP1GSC056_3958 [Leptospira borgpetersenii str. Brem 328]|uniref:Uncharacterized protein n=1 Tax=Leptospira borgpetersenii str. Brem 328 TaxID=1049780 RepID=A0ABC9SC64_LEPBO|nr:hypothetical protein LEP1GSC056_3958 [Leptospira borgpetersenii str. Brem 328]